MLDCITPGRDEIILPKTSSSVFQSTNIDYLLRSLGVRQLVLAGCVTGERAAGPDWGMRLPQGTSAGCGCMWAVAVVAMLQSLCDIHDGAVTLRLARCRI